MYAMPSRKYTPLVLDLLLIVLERFGDAASEAAASGKTVRRTKDLVAEVEYTEPGLRASSAQAFARKSSTAALLRCK
jgi:hypothetical protein